MWDAWQLVYFHSITQATETSSCFIVAPLGKKLFLFFCFKISNIDKFPILIEYQNHVHLIIILVWLPDCLPSPTGLEPPPAKGRSVVFQVVYASTSRLPDQRTPLGFWWSWGTTRVNILSHCVTYMGATLETCPVLVYSPVGVEMPSRDPFGAKQRSGEMSVIQPGCSDTIDADCLRPAVLPLAPF